MPVLLHSGKLLLYIDHLLFILDGAHSKGQRSDATLNFS